LRLWSLHPRYLDSRGLVALWREGLLAQAVLAGQTRGYTRHPQLERFRACRDPLAAIGAYLGEVLREAGARGYRFDGSRILRPARRSRRARPVTTGQLRFEGKHLLRKLRSRDPERAARFRREKRLFSHPFFRVVPGGIASWERP
jgi:hypothetical protein